MDLNSKNFPDINDNVFIAQFFAEILLSLKNSEVKIINDKFNSGIEPNLSEGIGKFLNVEPSVKKRIYTSWKNEFKALEILETLSLSKSKGFLRFHNVNLENQLEIDTVLINPLAWDEFINNLEINCIENKNIGEENIFEETDLLILKSQNFAYLNMAKNLKADFTISVNRLVDLKRNIFIYKTTIL